MLSRAPVRTAALAVLVLLAGCGGPDLGKANFQRTTIPAEPGGQGQGQVPTGPIDDPAVTVDALRKVDPCGLLGKELLGELGQVEQAEASGWDSCRTRVQDAGGKTVRLVLTLADTQDVTQKPVGNVEGLPLTEHKTDESTCFASALTSRVSNLGITVQVGYDGGDPCAPGRTVLGKAIQKLRSGPPTLPETAGSLVRADPCTSADDSVIAGVLPGEVKKVPSSLRYCKWTTSGPSLTVGFRIGSLPDDERTMEVDLGGGVKGVQKMISEDAAECTVSWQHRPVDDVTGELVSVQYSDYGTDAATADPCGKSLEVAKNVLGKLSE